MPTLLSRIFLASLLVGALGCGQAAVAGDATPAPLLAQRIAKGEAPVVLDVRSAEEFASGHVPGARNIPVDDLAAQLAGLESDRDVEVVVYCERGGRADRARDLLLQAGFSDVRRLEGDMRSWRSEGLPCEDC